MDGSHSIAVEGAPDLATTLTVDSNFARGGWSTAPIPLVLGFAIGTMQGRILLFNEHDTLANVITLADHGAPDELLGDTTTLYAIEVNGSVSAFTLDGKARWTAPGIGTMTASAIIADNVLVLSSGHTLAGLSLSTGQLLWSDSSSQAVVAIAYAKSIHAIAVGRSWNDPTKSDSIFFIGLNGKITAMVGLPSTEITSNIAIAGSTMTFGALMGASDSRSEPVVISYMGIDQSHTTLVWKHRVPFIPGTVALNSTAAFVSGIRLTDNASVSGISAFALHDTSTLWQRQFTDPIFAPIAASQSNVYFTMNFESQAIIPTRGLFYTLAAGDGRTLVERPLVGASEGVISAAPIPDDQGRFLIADRKRPVIHILDRSTLKRVF